MTPAMVMASATYFSSGTVSSTNLLSGSTASSINDFYYNLSSLPGNSSVTVQFSQDGTNWYSAAGTLNASTSISTIGGATIDLSALHWSGSSFYYKFTFYATTDQTGTPVINGVRVDYSTSGSNGGIFAINNGGHIAVGTTSALSTLDIAGGTAIGTYAGTAAAPNNSLILSGFLGVGTSTPSSKLTVAGDGYLSGNLTVNGSLSVAGSLFQINSNGTFTASSTQASAATSTVYGNLNVTGNLHGQTITSGDLVFANAFRFTEARLDGSPQGILLKNQYGSTTLSVDENGNLTVLGDICSNGNVSCWGRSIVDLNSGLASLASSTMLDISANAASTTRSMSELSSDIDKIDWSLNRVSSRLDALASSSLTMSALASATDAMASSAGSILASSTSFIQSVSQAVNSAIQSTGQWLANQITVAKGIFTELTAGKADIQTANIQTLCIGQTCVSESQFKAMLAHENVTPVQPSPMSAQSSSTNITTDTATAPAATTASTTMPAAVSAGTSIIATSSTDRADQTATTSVGVVPAASTTSATIMVSEASGTSTAAAVSETSTTSTATVYTTLPIMSSTTTVSAPVEPAASSVSESSTTAVDRVSAAPTPITDMTTTGTAPAQASTSAAH
ncbi:hypothetical protein KGQ27_00680 [Patescibacteria group bacterium]|nr:hypothetical protein [Patescibacteria group bacterium]MDE1946862.1 hypothetical protein [Patescibacteria group bacterium]MDE2010682.1 hypothetical protein [Patescibacteria group bacterium]